MIAAVDAARRTIAGSSLKNEVVCLACNLETYVIPVAQEQFNKEKPMLAQMLLLEKKNETFTDFLSQLRLKADLQENVSKTSNSENTVQ